jgi:hypothetical protein
VTTGTSMRIGNFVFHNFHGPSGSATGTTINIGNTTFTNYFWSR